LLIHLDLPPFVGDYEALAESGHLAAIGALRHLRHRTDRTLRLAPHSDRGRSDADIARLATFRLASAHLAAHYYDPPPPPPTVPYQVPWHTVTARCQVQLVDHAARGRALGLPPPPQVPADATSCFDPVISANEALVPRVDHPGAAEGHRGAPGAKKGSRFNLAAQRDAGRPNYLLGAKARTV
jgi:hypothetical protein